MKKTILGAIVIFFVMFACVLAINEVSSTSSDNNIQQHYSVHK